MQLPESIQKALRNIAARKECNAVNSASVTDDRSRRGDKSVTRITPVYVGWRTDRMHVRGVPLRKCCSAEAPMDAQPERIFPHRLDQNGIYHSVCMTCFRTVATSFSLAALVEQERQHWCEGPPLRVTLEPDEGAQMGPLAGKG